MPAVTTLLEKAVRATKGSDPMRAHSNHRLIEMLLDHCFDALAFGHAGHSWRCVLLAVLIFPTPAVSQEASRQNEIEQVTEDGDTAGNDAFIFVLDCSNSMAELISVAPRAALPQGDQRLSVAKRHMYLVLKELASKNEDGAQTQVGVRLLGHRASWDRRRPSRMHLHDSYLERFPTTKELTPSTDIETIQEIGRFDKTKAARVLERLKLVNPWGESPLYLALKDALQEFDEHPDDLRKSIIVVTDGGNYQVEPNTTASDVLDAWQKSHDVKIYILGLDTGPNQAEAARADLKVLAYSTGGFYINVSSDTDLRKKLRVLSKLDRN